MALFLHTGVPGSGKTYLLVNKFVDLFCEWDKEIGRFVLKEKHKDKILVSNIEGLTLPHLDLETLMHKRCESLARTKFIDSIGEHEIDEMPDVIDEYYYQYKEEKVRWFFNLPYQEALRDKLSPGSGLIYLIEESQRYFDGKELGRQKWVRDVFYFFEKHRHAGCSIFFDTQHVSKIAKGIVVELEMETRAKPRTFSLAGEFSYDEYSEGSKVNPFPIKKRPNQRIFASYKSMSMKEDVKPKKPALKIAVFIGFMAIAAFLVLSYAKSHLGPGMVQANELKKMPGKTSEAVLSVSNQGRWEHLAFVHGKNEFIVIHPITYSIMPLKELDLEVKRQGTILLVRIPENY